MLFLCAITCRYVYIMLFIIDLIVSTLKLIHKFGHLTINAVINATSEAIPREIHNLIIESKNAKRKYSKIHITLYFSRYT